MLGKSRIKVMKDREKIKIDFKKDGEVIKKKTKRLKKGI